ncbi:MAG: magnesium transporter CorA family protein [Acidobacteriota bacterium]|nr:magnesium transporter CorA family protein [Acidobacteriota bacterium]
MNWSDVDAAGTELDQVSARYGFHPLHVEDCRSDAQRAKVEEGDGYLFIVLKRVVLRENNELTVADLDLFVGPDYLVTVHKQPDPALQVLREKADQWRPDEGLYRVMDATVDLYYPLLEELEDRIDAIESDVLRQPAPAVLERMAEIRTSLLDLRRVLSNTRQVAYTLQRGDRELIGRKLLPFLRDIYDHLARDLDTVARESDRLRGLLDLYQSSLANQSNEAARLLTVVGTIALPAVVISAFCGMSLRYPSWMLSDYAFTGVCGITVLATAAVLWILKRRGYFS